MEYLMLFEKARHDTFKFESLINPQSCLGAMWKFSDVINFLTSDIPV